MTYTDLIKSKTTKYLKGIISAFNSIDMEENSTYHDVINELETRMSKTEFDNYLIDNFKP